MEAVPLFGRRDTTHESSPSSFGLTYHQCQAQLFPQGHRGHCDNNQNGRGRKRGGGVVGSFKDGLVIVVVIGKFPLLNSRKLGATSTSLEYCLTDTNYTISFSRGKASISKTQNPEAKRAKNTFNCASWLLIRLSHQEIAILVCKM